MYSFTLAALGFLGLQLNAVSAFHVAVPVQSSNMRTSTALKATEGKSELLAFWCRSQHPLLKPEVVSLMALVKGGSASTDFVGFRSTSNPSTNEDSKAQICVRI